LDKDLASALALFREMPLEGVPYNTITYNSILDACVKCGDLATAEGLLREMTAPESALDPDLITFSTLLKGYCHLGNLEKALQVAEAIKARGLRCDELVYNTLMDGCVKANDITAGVGLFEEMVQNGMRPSTITHSILSKLCQNAAYEEGASEMVAQLYQHHGMERPSGSDRGKNFGRRMNPRSPNNRVGGGDRGGGGAGGHQSPWGSPSAASTISLHGHGFGDGNIPAMPGTDCASVERSAPSTPLNGSPLQSSPYSQGGVAPLLPMEAIQRASFVPPLPGATGGFAASPFSLPSCTAGSLHPSPFPSVAGSPCGSQHSGIDQLGFHILPSSPHPQAGCSPMMTHMQQQQQQQQQQQPWQQQLALPPWPFSCPFQAASASMGVAPPLPPTGRQGGDTCLQQVLAVTMMQQMPPMTPGGAQSSSASISTMPGGTPGAGGVEPFGKQQPQTQQPFSMPMPPPHDMTYCGAPGQPPQTYFENWSSMPGQQQAGAGMQIGAGTPMGAMMGGNMQIGSSAQGLFLS